MLHIAAAHRGTANSPRTLRPAGSGTIYRIVKVAVGSIEIWMVKNVGSVCADLQTDALGKVESLPQRKIRCIDSWRPKRIPA